MAIEIRTLSVAQAETDKDFSSLIAEYAEESAIHGLPPTITGEKVVGYKAIENSGMFQAYGAYLEDRLIGFVAVITPVMLHYGVAISVAESLFVTKAHRKTGVGLQLIRIAQDHARKAGSPGILFSAPSGGQLTKVLPKLGYQETNVTFFKGFDDAGTA